MFIRNKTTSSDDGKNQKVKKNRFLPENSRFRRKKRRKIKKNGISITLAYYFFGAKESNRFSSQCSCVHPDESIYYMFQTVLSKRF